MRSLPTRAPALDLLEQTLDPGSFRRWDTEPVPVPPAAEYATQLARAQAQTGLDESVITGEGRIRGRRVAVLAVEFHFLAGSIGVVAAQRLAAAVRRATSERLPLLAAPASGGTRLQEGTIAFLQMVKISAAIAAHKAAGLPYLVYLRNPTLGGVLASWGSLGHLTVAEPGALIGFLGPKVIQALSGSSLPRHVQTAEHLYRHGLVDAVVRPSDIPDLADRALNVLQAGWQQTRAPTDPPTPTTLEQVPDTPAWESVTRSRRDGRPTVRHLLRHAATDVVPLNGTSEGEREPGLLLVLARFGGVSCVLVGHDRRRQPPDRPFGLGGLRGARRGMRLARDLRLPLVTLIDTGGIALSKEAEEGGLAGEIARTLTDLVTLAAPTISVLLGQGAGGGALAFLPADRVVAAQHAWLAPLPPEGTNAVVHGEASQLPHLAQQQGIRARDLLQAGIVDRVVLEHPDAAEEPEAFCHRLGAVLAYELANLAATDADQRLAARLDRYDRIGQ